jgi:hypothetical protein
VLAEYAPSAIPCHSRSRSNGDIAGCAGAGVDINIVCHLISAGKRELKVDAHVTFWFSTSISSPPVMAYRNINLSGPKHFNSGCRYLSSYQ